MFGWVLLSFKISSPMLIQANQLPIGGAKPKDLQEELDFLSCSKSRIWKGMAPIKYSGLSENLFQSSQATRHYIQISNDSRIGEFQPPSNIKFDKLSY